MLHLCCVCDCNFPLIVKPLTKNVDWAVQKETARGRLFYNLAVSLAIWWQMVVSSSFGQDFLAD